MFIIEVMQVSLSIQNYLPTPFLPVCLKTAGFSLTQGLRGTDGLNFCLFFAVSL